LAGHCYFGFTYNLALVGGWTRSKELFLNVIILFLIGITTGRTEF